MKRISIALLISVFALIACRGPFASARDFGREEFIEALRAQGIDAQAGDTIGPSLFSGTGRFVKLDGESVQTFEYETAESLEKDAARVAADGGSINTTVVDWIATPHFYKKGRVLVLYLGDDVQTLNLLEKVLGRPFAGR